jgi:hypothetical protein
MPFGDHGKRFTMASFQTFNEEIDMIDLAFNLTNTSCLGC